MKVEVKGSQYLRRDAEDIHIVASEGEIDLMTLFLDGEEACSIIKGDQVLVDGEVVWLGTV